MNVVVVDSNNRLLIDIHIDNNSIVFNEDACEVDYFEQDTRVRIKKEIVSNDKKKIQVTFREADDMDIVKPHFGDPSNG